jgi:Cellulose-binding Sde182, nucleoside hydrolase-like domain
MNQFRLLCLVFSVIGLAFPALADALQGGALAGERYRVLVSTDVGGSDPDDLQSMVHLMFYADCFDLEGLISSPPSQGRKKHILELIAAYETDYPLLKAKSKRFPKPEFLRSITRQGAIKPAPAAGYSQPTEGSRWIVRQACRQKSRPLYILVWGSITDIAQAVHDDPTIKKKIRVYFIGSWNTKMDPNARDYLFNHHKDLWWIENNTTFRGMYVGGKQQGDLSNTEFPRRHLKGRGALGDLFMQKMPRLKMGDTPSLLYLMRGDPNRPDQPHWGGQFRKTKHGPHYWTDLRKDKVKNPGASTVQRWREDYLRDWQNRSKWLK